MPRSLVEDGPARRYRGAMPPYPPRELWPEKIHTLPELIYPETCSAGFDLLDRNLPPGRGSCLAEGKHG
jgi:hypothetical protein